MAASGTLATLIGFFGDWHWYADLFSHLRPQYCVWFGLTIALTLYFRQRLALFIALLGLCINVAALLPYGLPWRNEQGAQAQAAPQTFAIINLLYGNREAARVCDYLRSVKPDVVVFQEVGFFWASALEELSDLYPYRTIKARKDGFGSAIYSRQKPLEATIRVAGERESDYAVFATWETDGQRVNLVGVHPDKPDKEWKVKNRKTYLANVTQWCSEKAQAGEPIIALGDFNATPWSSSLRRFTRETKLRNANQGVIFGATWNVYQPHRLLIDHAFLSQHWSLLHREIGPDVGSDHRPLLVRAALHKGATANSKSP